VSWDEGGSCVSLVELVGSGEDGGRVGEVVRMDRRQSSPVSFCGMRRWDSGTEMLVA